MGADAEVFTAVGQRARDALDHGGELQVQLDLGQSGNSGFVHGFEFRDNPLILARIGPASDARRGKLEILEWIGTQCHAEL